MARLEIRLSEEEFKGLQEWEEKNDLAGKRSVIIRTILRGLVNDEPEVAPLDLSAFRQATTQLRSIGRNLNQITRAINQDHRNLNQITDRKIDELKTYVSNIVTEISGLYGQSRKCKMGIISKISMAITSE